MRTRLALCLLFLTATIVCSVTGCSAEEAPAPEASLASFVGGQTCTQCHQVEHDLWVGSHHDLAMQPADEQTVLGDFDDASFTHFGVTSSFYKLDGGFWVSTDGPDGELHDYEIKYTFGVTPLQQYLIEFSGGRLQAFSISWDTRPAAEGGQRWFHLYPDEEIAHDDLLHWTRRGQNWNYMCAECHSTNLVKNYDLESDTFFTVWSELDVSCEACHGPGSDHVDWAEALDRGETPPDVAGTGLPVALKDPDAATWVFDPDAVTARRSTPLASHAQVEACARCHSRRTTLTDDYVHGKALMDSHLPSLLRENLYQADGQIQEEVYVWGSFLQSKMYHQGVTCSDCHEPHSLNLIASGNSLCSRCHSPETFDTPSHHFHQTGSAGASCVECHMPATTYMVVDPRRDHSLRVPRPDLSVQIGTPDACTRCHEDQPASWAAEAVEEWYGPKTDQPAHYAEALHAGRTQQPEAVDKLTEVITGEYPGIARGSAMALLGTTANGMSIGLVTIGLRDPDPLVRWGTLHSLIDAPGALRIRAFELLRDPVMAVRIEAVSVLAPFRRELTVAQQEIFDRAGEEFVNAQMVNADQVWANFNLGNYYGHVEQYLQSEASYLRAIALDRTSVEPYVNLADVYYRQNRDDKGEALLRRALREHETAAALHHALGLVLVRLAAMLPEAQGLARKAEALASLRTANYLEPGNARYALVYGVALQDGGHAQEAVRILLQAHQRYPRDTEILISLATVYHELGLREEALEYARKLVALDRNNLEHQRFLQGLQRRR